MRFIRTLGCTLFDHKRNEELMDIMDKQLKATPIIDFVAQCRKNWKEHVHRMTPGRIPKNDFKIPTKRKEMFRPTSQKMEGLCYVMPVTGHKAYTGKEEEEDISTAAKLSITLQFSAD
jgi:hypothetical protein